ncbi:MAG: hypothetical protein KGN38_12700, partial [Actinomycetales bacterium]|nr:hypothetical protein [Actinomycetales bacterium]
LEDELALRGGAQAGAAQGHQDGHGRSLSRGNGLSAERPRMGREGDAVPRETVEVAPAQVVARRQS